MIQGPNKNNQMTIILSEFVSMSNDILMLDNHYDSKFNSKIEYNDYVLKSALKSGANMSMNMSRSMSFSNNDVSKIDYSQFIAKPKNNYLLNLAKYRILNILNYLLDGFESSDYVFYLYRRELNPQCFRKIYASEKYYFDQFYKSKYQSKVFFNYT